MGAATTMMEAGAQNNVNMHGTQAFGASIALSPQGNGATHMNFAGNGQSWNVEALSIKAISAFLEGVHRGDCKLREPILGIEISTK